MKEVAYFLIFFSRKTLNSEKIFDEFIQPKIVSPQNNRNPYGELSEDSAEEEKIDEINEKNSKKIEKKTGRTSVSAEVYGLFNKKSDYKPKTIIKSKEQTNKIKERITQSFLFADLGAKDLETVLNSFEERKYKYFSRSIFFLKDLLVKEMLLSTREMMAIISM